MHRHCLLAGTLHLVTRVRYSLRTRDAFCEKSHSNALLKSRGFFPYTPTRCPPTGEVDSVAGWNVVVLRDQKPRKLKVQAYRDIYIEIHKYRSRD